MWKKGEMQSSVHSDILKKCVALHSVKVKIHKKSMLSVCNNSVWKALLESKENEKANKKKKDICFSLTCLDNLLLMSHTGIN